MLKKIKYRDSDGTILALGYLKAIVPEVGETVEDYSGDFLNHRLDFYKRVGINQIEEKSQAEKDIILNAEKKFTPQRLKNYVNAGATQAEKFDRLLNVVAKLAGQIKESEV